MNGENPQLFSKKTLDEIKNDLVRENINGRCEPRA
jgi:hypothetical protein